jgi:hypothetical protein
LILLNVGAVVFGSKLRSLLREPTMKLLELMAELGVWPFDAEVRSAGPAEDQLDDTRRAIVLPKEMRPVLVRAAQWPSEYSRLTRH